MLSLDGIVSELKNWHKQFKQQQPKQPPQHKTWHWLKKVVDTATKIAALLKVKHLLILIEKLSKQYKKT
ncbi:MAG: hypothetical protein DRR19_05805 [Candidatus Parabeggiatoa sp. nov. 1]|nr:MAG: hypothetical protein DRR19_05805 [Gammaproteobacteria bacterium]